MKLLKSLAGEFVLLIALFILTLAIAKLGMHFYFDGQETLDIYVAGEIIVFGLFRISSLLFVPIVCLVYGIRFIFFLPRKLHLGIIAVSFMLTAHACMSFYGPLYEQYRTLTSDFDFFEMPDIVGYNSLGNPIFDLDSFSMDDKWKEHKESIKKELKWFQFGLALITLLQVLLLMRCITKKPDREILAP